MEFRLVPLYSIQNWISGFRQMWHFFTGANVSANAFSAYENLMARARAGKRCRKIVLRQTKHFKNKQF
jgi:hypothetical protein